MKAKFVVVVGTGNDAGTAVAKAASIAPSLGWTLKNTSAADAWVGPSGVSNTTGYYLEPGGILTGQTRDIIYGYPNGATFRTWEETA